MNTIFFVVAIVAILLWMFNAYIEIKEPLVKKIVNFTTVIATIIWVLIKTGTIKF